MSAWWYRRLMLSGPYKTTDFYWLYFNRESLISRIQRCRSHAIDNFDSSELLWNVSNHIIDNSIFWTIYWASKLKWYKSSIFYNNSLQWLLTRSLIYYSIAYSTIFQQSNCARRLLLNSPNEHDNAASLWKLFFNSHLKPPTFLLIFQIKHSQ